MKIACPHCTQHIDLDESWFGKLLSCPTCQGIIDIPNQRTYEAIALPQQRGEQGHYRRMTYMAIIGAFAMVTIMCWLGTIRLWTHSGNSGSESATDDLTALIPEQGAGSQHGRQARQSEPSQQLGAYSAHKNPLAISVDAEGPAQMKKPNLFQRLYSGAKKKKLTPARPEEILTKAPKHLAQDGASNTLEFYLPDMVRDYRNRFGKVPMYSYRTTVEDMMRENTEPEIVTIVNQTVVPRLAELGLARDYDADALRMHFRNQAEKPFIYAKDLSYESVARFAERGVGFAGVRLKISPDTAAFTGEKQNLATNPTSVLPQQQR